MNTWQVACIQDHRGPSAEEHAALIAGATANVEGLTRNVDCLVAVPVADRESEGLFEHECPIRA
eukprot:1156802-Pelagomonas_calceolata.AAC.1